MTASLTSQLAISREKLEQAQKKEEELTGSIPTLEGHARQNALNDLFMEQIRLRQLQADITALEAAKSSEELGIQ
jgi:hypothetical protein